jgi:hypothetical protein
VTIEETTAMPHHHLSAGSVEAPRPEPSATQLAALRLDLTQAQRARLTEALGRAVQLVLADDDCEPVGAPVGPVVTIIWNVAKRALDVELDGEPVGTVGEPRPDWIGWQATQATAAAVIRRVADALGATVVEFGRDEAFGATAREPGR